MGDLRTPKGHFEINWPLIRKPTFGQKVTVHKGKKSSNLKKPAEYASKWDMLELATLQHDEQDHGFCDQNLDLWPVNQQWCLWMTPWPICRLFTWCESSIKACAYLVLITSVENISWGKLYSNFDTCQFFETKTFKGQSYIFVGKSTSAINCY